MPVVYYPPKFPSDLFMKLEQLAESARGPVLPQTQDADIIIMYRRSVDAECNCRRRPLLPQPQGDASRCPIPQMTSLPSDVSADREGRNFSLVTDVEGGYEVFMQIGGCYRPWFSAEYLASPLHWAAAIGDCQFAARYLAANLQTSLLRRDVKGNTALMLVSAARQACNCPEAKPGCMVEMILKRCQSDEDRRALVRAKNADHLTALHFAALNARPDIVRILLENGADPNVGHVVRNGIKVGLTPLHMSAFTITQNSLVCFGTLLQYGADVTVKIAFRKAAGSLHYTCCCGGCWSEPYWILEGLSPFATDYSLLGLSLRLCDNKKISVLLSKTYSEAFNVNGNYKYRPIAFAVQSFSSYNLQLLIQRHADVNVLCEWPVFHLHAYFAFQHKTTRPLFWLLSRNPVRLCVWCYSALNDYESEINCIDVLLASKRCDVNLKDFDGNSPLLLAIKGTKISYCLALLQHGASPVAQDNEGQSPLYLACKLDDEYIRDELVDLLLKSGVASYTYHVHSFAYRGSDDSKSPIRVVFERRDTKTLFKLFHAGALSADTLRIMLHDLELNLAGMAGPNLPSHSASLNFSRTIQYLLNTSPSLYDRCIHLLSMQAGLGCPSSRKERLRNRNDIRCLDDRRDGDETPGSLLSLIMQRMKVLRLL